jgi:hypothetical protein
MTSEVALGDILTSVYGLTVSSDLHLPELQPAHAGSAVDVAIRQGPVPEPTITDPSDIRYYLESGPDYLRLNLPGILRMDIRGGAMLTYYRHPGIEDDEIRLFLLGSGLGAILMQRGFVVIHGNAIIPQGQAGAIVCIGDSGAGKSTTAVAMMQRGLKILADDICPLGADRFVLPGMARAKLWQETALQLGINTANLSRICGADAKFNLPLGDSHCTEQQLVRAFYWLVPDDVDGVTIDEVTGAEKFTILRNNVYRPEYLRPLGLEAEYMARLAQIAAKTPVFKLLRPKSGFDIDAVLDTILNNHRQLPEPALRAPFVPPKLEKAKL